MSFLFFSNSSKSSHPFLIAWFACMKQTTTKNGLICDKQNVQQIVQSCRHLQPLDLIRIITTIIMATISATIVYLDVWRVANIRATQLPSLSQSLSDVFYCSSMFLSLLQFIISARSEQHIRRRRRNWLKWKIIIHHQRRALSVINKKAVESRAYKACRVQLLASIVAMMKNCAQKRREHSLICAPLLNCQCKNINIHHHAEAQMAAIVDDQSRPRIMAINTQWWTQRLKTLMLKRLTCSQTTQRLRKLMIQTILLHTEPSW